MLLYCQGVLRKVLDQELVLKVISLLSHLNDHVLLVGWRFRQGSALPRTERRRLLLMHVHGTRLRVHRRVRCRGRLRIRCLEKVATVFHAACVESSLPEALLLR